MTIGSQKSPRSNAWTNTLRSCAETQSPYFLAMLANGRNGNRFTSLGWNGVLDVTPEGEVIGAGHRWHHAFGHIAEVQPYVPARSRALVLA